MTQVDETPSVGSRAPDFTLSAATGEIVTLSDQLRLGHVVLYFVREFS